MLTTLLPCAHVNATPRTHRRVDMHMVQNIKVSSKWTFSPEKDPKSSHLRAAERLAPIGVPMLQLVQNIKVTSN